MIPQRGVLHILRGSGNGLMLLPHGFDDPSEFFEGVVGRLGDLIPIDRMLGSNDQRPNIFDLKIPKRVDRISQDL